MLVCFLYLRPTDWAIGSPTHPPIHPSFSLFLSPFIPLSLHPQSSPQEEAIGSGCMSGSLVRVSFLVGIMLRDPPGSLSTHKVPGYFFFFETESHVAQANLELPV